MAEPLVLSALVKKRAEIDGALRDTEKRIAQLRAERDVIDAAIRIFDPSRLPNRHYSSARSDALLRQAFLA